MTEFRLVARPLTASTFRPFGDLLDTASAKPRTINQGLASRFNDLCHVDVEAGEGRVNVSLFTANPRPSPIAIKLMERHPLGSQAFVPMQDRPWLVLVCHDPLDISSYQLFSASGRQGVNYARNIWHHPLLVFDDHSHFLIIDRKGPGDTLDEVWLPDKWTVHAFAHQP
jgi:ureidoglycolate lyase